MDAVCLWGYGVFGLAACLRSSRNGSSQTRSLLAWSGMTPPSCSSNTSPTLDGLRQSLFGIVTDGQRYVFLYVFFAKLESEKVNRSKTLPIYSNELASAEQSTASKSIKRVWNAP